MLLIQQIFNAINNGEFGHAITLLSSKNEISDINHRDNKGNSLLNLVLMDHYVLLDKDKDNDERISQTSKIINILLEKQIDTNIRNFDGENALELSLSLADKASPLVNELIEKLPKTHDNVLRAIKSSIDSNSFEHMKTLLKYINNINQIASHAIQRLEPHQIDYLFNQQKITIKEKLIHSALLSYNIKNYIENVIEIIDVMIKYQVDINEKGINGNTILHLMLSDYNKGLIIKFLEYTPKIDICNAEGHSVIDLIAENNNERGIDKVISALFKHGYENEMSESNNGYFFLQKAPNARSFKKLILTNNFDLNKLYDGENALTFAAQKFPNDVSVFYMLLKHGANINSTNDEGKMAINYLSNPEIIEYLIESGSYYEENDTNNMKKKLTGYFSYDNSSFYKLKKLVRATLSFDGKYFSRKSSEEDRIEAFKILKNDISAFSQWVNVLELHSIDNEKRQDIVKNARKKFPILCMTSYEKKHVIYDVGLMALSNISQAQGKVETAMFNESLSLLNKNEKSLIKNINDLEVVYKKSNGMAM